MADQNHPSHVSWAYAFASDSSSSDDLSAYAPFCKVLVHEQGKRTADNNGDASRYLKICLHRFVYPPHQSQLKTGAPSLEMLKRQLIASKVISESSAFHLEYEDDDGDLIVLTCDEDLKDALLHPPADGLKFRIWEQGTRSGLQEIIMNLKDMQVEGDLRITSLEDRLLAVEKNARNTESKVVEEMVSRRFQEIHKFLETVSAQQNALEPRPSQPNPFVLRLIDATKYNVFYHGPKETGFDFLEFRADISSMASWEVHRLVPGRYRASIKTNYSSLGHAPITLVAGTVDIGSPRKNHRELISWCEKQIGAGKKVHPTNANLDELGTWKSLEFHDFDVVGSKEQAFILLQHNKCKGRHGILNVCSVNLRYVGP